MWLIVPLVLVLLAVRVAPPRLRLLFWIAVIVIGVVPWFSATGHAHWPRIGWVPFSSPPIRVRDIVVNAALYVPFGVFWRRPGHRPVWRHAAGVAAGAFCLSVVTELTQVYSHGRFPSMTDVTMNTVGAWAGGLFAPAVQTRTATAPADRMPPSRPDS
jgi:glycopeptide antibiotics resistance protein